MSSLVYVSRRIGKRIGKTNYRYVSICEYLGDANRPRGIIYKGAVPKLGWVKYFDNEREAAIAVDMTLIKNNRKPVNILKPKE